MHFTGVDVFLVPFSLLWCGFAVFWTVSAMRSAGFGFAAFGLIFVALGLYLVVGRFVVKAHRNRSTTYGITDRRVVVATGPRSIDEIPTLGQPMSIRRGHDHVSVVIGAAPRFQQAMYANTGLDFWSRSPGSVGLWDVSDIEPVLSALRRSQAT